MGDHTSELPSARASSFYAATLVWDNVFPIDLPGELSIGNSWEQLARFSAAGIDVISVTLAGDNHNAAQALHLCAWARREIRNRSDTLRMVRSIADIEDARRNGKLGVVLHFEGTRCFERRPDLVEMFYELGIRQTLLAFNVQNELGGGCAEDPDPGLTRLGCRMMDEIQRVGMLLDLSHTGYRTSLDAMHRATRPVIFSHSNVFALCPSFRNLKDEQIIACAATGGLIGISGSSEYLGDPLCRTETIFRHLDYVAQLVGVNHVALGQDVVFEPDALTRWAKGRPDEWPMVTKPGWPGFRYAMPEQLPELAETLLRNGYSERDTGKILGENLRRVCTEVWR